MKNRKILAFVLIAVLTFSMVFFAGCGSEETPQTPAVTPGESAGNTDTPTEGTTDADELSCTIYISCAVLLDNMDMLDKDKHDLVPADGVILPVTTVTFEDGDDVFTLLQRVCRENKIHLEFSEDPIYSSAYVEGLNNLYEFDGGELSGWYYSANGWFPNYGSSRYVLEDGDVIEWHYSCDMGHDLEGYVDEY
jgi:hypothetical protein